MSNRKTEGGATASGRRTTYAMTVTSQSSETRDPPRSRPVRTRTAVAGAMAGRIRQPRRRRGPGGRGRRPQPGGQGRRHRPGLRRRRGVDLVCVPHLRRHRDRRRAPHRHPPRGRGPPAPHPGVPPHRLSGHARQVSTAPWPAVITVPGITRSRQGSRRSAGEGVGGRPGRPRRDDRRVVADRCGRLHERLPQPHPGLVVGDQRRRAHSAVQVSWSGDQ